MRKQGNAKPFVKWAGGKQALAASIVKSFPRRVQAYYEPFVGGGSVFLTLQPRRGVLSDANEWLMDCYRAIREDWKAVARVLDTLVNTKEEYLKVRSICPTELDLPNRAAHLIYLNKTCFRGLFRVNKQGRFNVPYGAYDRRFYDPANLERVSAAIQNVEIRSGDFEEALDGIRKQDFAYLDPPYYKLGGYSDFNRYTSSKFRESDHMRLAALGRELDRRGVRWALSNSNTSFIRGLFTGFRLSKISARREINLNSSDRDISELLITNY